MKKTKILIFIIALIRFNSLAQELSCTDFHQGTFYIPTTEELKNFTFTKNNMIQDFVVKLDSTVTKTVIERKKNTQIEWINKIGNGKPAYEKIEWVDDCTYRLTYDEYKMELDETEKLINENNGILVTKRQIEKNCLFYIATLTFKSGEKISQSGVICKE